MKRLLILICVMVMHASDDACISENEYTSSLVEEVWNIELFEHHAVNEIKRVEASELSSLKPPKRIVIPDLNVNALIEPVGLDSAGRVGTIENPAVIAWYKYGAIPGDRGNAILAGHRDGRGKLGSFGNIERLEPDSSIEIEFEDGSRKMFVVQTNDTYLLNKVPEEVMQLNGGQRVTLITCGGKYVKEKGGYQSRVVVILKQAGE